MASVDTQHPDYSSAMAKVQRVRDAVAGQDAVHSRGGGETYLPKLTGQSATEYGAYKLRAGWFGATGRTHEGLLGMVFRVAPTHDAPTSLEAALEDVTQAGDDAAMLSRKVLAEVMESGRCFLMADYPTVENAEGLTVAAAQASGLRPFISIYKAETLINWREERINGRVQLSLVVLKEDIRDPNQDEFGQDQIEQIRVLILDRERPKNGRAVDMAAPLAYRQRLYRARDGKFQEVADYAVMMGGKQLQEIPGRIIGPGDICAGVQLPPLLDLADVNLSHYRTSADLEHGAHFTGLPTPVIAGIEAEIDQKTRQPKPVPIGSAEALILPDSKASWGYLEFTGVGLTALETRQEKKEGQMAALGARMLAPEKAGVESEGALTMRTNGEAASLAGIAANVSRGLSIVLSYWAAWQGVSQPIKYELNRDYMPAGMTAQELTALVAAWQSGAISWNTLFHSLKRGEIIPEGVSPEDEQASIEAMPTLGMMSQQAAIDAAANPQTDNQGGAQ